MWQVVGESPGRGEAGLQYPEQTEWQVRPFARPATLYDPQQFSAFLSIPAKYVISLLTAYVLLSPLEPQSLAREGGKEGGSQ